MSNLLNNMRATLISVAVLCASSAILDAQQAAPAPARVAPAPRHAPAAVAAPAGPRFRPATTTGAAASHGLGFGSGMYRQTPGYTPRQFQPHAGAALPAYRNFNRPTNRSGAEVTPRVTSIPQRDTSVVARSQWQNRTAVSPNRTSVGTADQNASNRTGRNWRGPNGNYAGWHDAWRRYHRERHDRDWWRQHHRNIVLVNGGYYYWDTGWWYPAWGYDPVYNNYAYDGPIYGYDGLPPDQVISDVQTALQQEGYYNGMIDGQLGPATRQALADWQRDHGLAITTAIDYATLASLGLS